MGRVQAMANAILNRFFVRKVLKSCGRSITKQRSMLIRQRWSTDAEHDMFAIRRKACETPSWHSLFTWRPRKTENIGCARAVTIRSATAMLTNQKFEIIFRLGFVLTVPITNTLPIVPRSVDKIFTDSSPAMCPGGNNSHCTVVDELVE